jgi:hypothetical protein
MWMRCVPLAVVCLSLLLGAGRCPDPNDACDETVEPTATITNGAVPLTPDVTLPMVFADQGGVGYLGGVSLTGFVADKSLFSDSVFVHVEVRPAPDSPPNLPLLLGQFDLVAPLACNDDLTASTASVIAGVDEFNLPMPASDLAGAHLVFAVVVQDTDETRKATAEAVFTAGSLQ